MWGHKKPGRQHSHATSAGQVERWLARAPLISQAEIDAMEPVELHEVLGDYEQSLRTPWVEDFAGFVDRLACGIPGPGERAQARREAAERARQWQREAADRASGRPSRAAPQNLTVEQVIREGLPKGKAVPKDPRGAEPGSRDRERIDINPLITKEIGSFALEKFETRNGFALPYKDVLFTSARVHPDYRNWTGSVWRRDENTVVVRWKPGPLEDVFR